MPSIVGNKTPNQWQQVNSSLVSTQKSIADALGNHVTIDADAKARAASFTAIKSV